ncbi:MAG TPA: ATP-binding protein [Solirubrobacteraceae bacterium]|jgi:anti-sigma regulatory factor (Ser/Thr protein kinase)|nr:ATP-binding protein [Solirubrobacteraceae bacterium]
MGATRLDHDLRLRLELLSVPDSVRMIRSVLHTVTHADELDPDRMDDMRLAISEACNNVVLHAYPSTPGPLIFSLVVRGDWIEAVVRDQGCGIRPGVARSRGLGMGVTLINALADRAEFETSELGTEVRMRFRRPAPPSPPLSLGVWALTDR